MTETEVLGGVVFFVLAFALAGVWVYRRRAAAAQALQLRQVAIAEDRQRRRQLRKARAEDNLAAIRHPKPGLERRPVVLIVDDSESVRLALRRLLEDADYRIIQAENGRKAWQILQEEHPDAIVSDIDMPHITGLELVDLLQNDLKLADIPVILMTSHLTCDVQVGPETGVSGFLPKPFHPPDVLTQLRYVLAE